MKQFKLLSLLIVICLIVPQSSYAQKKKTQRKSKVSSTRGSEPKKQASPIESIDNMTAEELWKKFCFYLEKNDEDASVKYVKKAAEKKHPEAMYILGLAQLGIDAEHSVLLSESGDDKKYSKFHVSKLGLSRDEKLASELFKQSAEKGYGLAMVKYGSYLIYTNQYDDAFKLLTKAADCEDSYNEAVSLIGRCYLDGLGCEKNEQLGLQLLSALMKRDTSYEPYVSSVIGNYFSSQQKYAKAAPWLHRAAELNDPEAMGTLASMYLGGFGVIKDSDKACEYAKKSAEKGCKWGKYNLALCYLYGIGVEKDSFKAKKLCNEMMEEAQDDEERELIKTLLE